MRGISLFSSKNSKFERSIYQEYLNEILLGDLEIKFSSGTTHSQFSLISTASSQASYTYVAKEKIHIFVDGYFVENLQSTKNTSDWFAERYLLQRNNKYFLSSLNGSYNILLVNEVDNSIQLISDKYGTRPLFIFHSDDCFHVSPSSKLPSKMGMPQNKLNVKQVACQLSYSRIWMNNETFFENVKSFPARAIAQWSPTTGFDLKYYKEKPHELQDGHVDIVEFSELFRDVILDYNKIENTGICLTGGLDSRLLLAAGFKGESFTWGYNSGNDEILLAERCASINGNKWNYINLLPEDFLDINSDGDKLREGLDLFVQSYGLISYPKIKKHGMSGLITGLALDFTLAGSYFPEDYMKIKSPNCIFKYIKSKSESFSFDERNKLFKDNVMHILVDEIENDIHQQLNENKEENTLDIIDDFFMENRVRRYIFQRQQWQRAFFEDYIPTFDDRIINYIKKIPKEKIINHSVFSQLLNELNYDLASINYQGTLLPANVPTKFWKQARDIESQRENLYRNIFKKTNGKTFIPYNRYYSNFDEWLRMNNLWLEEVERLLLREDNMLENYINMDVVKDWVSFQKAGEGNYFNKIIQLMSLEKTLRTHFD